jgi:beta-mannosidase
MADYHDYPRFEGRFISEFGMGALPDLTTLESIAPTGELYPNSRTLEFHNKAEGATRRIGVYLNDNLPLFTGMSNFIYATQFIQAEALGIAYSGWRRRWGGPGNYAVAGALVWQLNDCWPTTSWAIADYTLHPKAAYYRVKREMAEVAIGFADLKNGSAAVWTVNSRTTPIEAEVILRQRTLAGQAVQEQHYKLSLAPNQTTELGSFTFKAESQLIMSALVLEQGQVIARGTLWPEPFKYLTLPDPQLEIVRLGNDKLRLKVARPAKGILLAAPDVKWSDNMLDLLPGEPQEVTALGLGEAEIQVQSLYSLR